VSYPRPGSTQNFGALAPQITLQAHNSIQKIWKSDTISSSQRTQPHATVLLFGSRKENFSAFCVISYWKNRKFRKIQQKPGTDHGFIEPARAHA
jgi:hypothetical protein